MGHICCSREVAVTPRVLKDSQALYNPANLPSKDYLSFFSTSKSILKGAVMFYFDSGRLTKVFTCIEKDL